MRFPLAPTNRGTINLETAMRWPQTSNPSPAAEDRKAEPHIRISVGRQIVYAAVACAALLALVELLLAAAGVQPLIQRQDPSHGFSGLVPIFEREGDRYVTRTSLRKQPFNVQGFAAKKPSGAVRIFCLGGSSAYGFPWTADEAFSGVLGDLLAVQRPGHGDEVVNVAGISYAMHRLNIVARELAAYQPDIVVVFSGHNEFVERDFYDALRQRGALAAGTYHLLAHSRLYSALHAAVHETTAPSVPRTTDFDMVVRRRQDQVYSDAEKHQVVDDFQAGLATLMQAAQASGARVVLVTVPCNLRDWPPQRSQAGGNADGPARQSAVWSAAYYGGRRSLAAGEYREAVRQLQRSLEMAPGNADAYFLLGRAHEGVQEWEAAARCYQQACDADASPIRRLSAMNDTVREVAAESGALLVDADRDFAEQSPHGLVGFNLIEDYVHPTREGHQRIAWLVWRALRKAGWIPQGGKHDATAFEKIVQQRQGTTSYQNPEWLFNQGVVLQSQGHVDRAVQRYREAVTADPTYATALQNLAILLLEQGELDEAGERIEQFRAAAPEDPAADGLLGDLRMSQDRPQDAERVYRQVLARRPDSVRDLNRLGASLAFQDKLDEAAEQFQRAIALEPQFAESHANQARILQLQDRPEAAITAYRRAITLDPDLAGARYLLGQLYQSQGRTLQARQQFQRVLVIDPDHAGARQQLDALDPPQR